jgi:WD40 repeat protein
MTGNELGTFEGHSDPVVFSPDGCTALSGSADKTVKLWELATGKVLRTFIGHSKEVTAVAFSPDGRTMLSGGADSKVTLWDITTGTQIQSLVEEHAEEISPVAFSPDGRAALVGTWSTSGQFILRLRPIVNLKKRLLPKNASGITSHARPYPR